MKTLRGSSAAMYWPRRVSFVVVALLLGMTIYAGVRYNDASDGVQKVGALAGPCTPPPTACNGTPPTPRPSGCRLCLGHGAGRGRQRYLAARPARGAEPPLHRQRHCSVLPLVSGRLPVQCWAADYGLFVAAEPVGSQWKYNITAPQARMEAMVGGLLPVAGAAAGRGAGVLPVVQLARGTPFAGGGRRAGHFSPGRRGAAAHHRLCRGAGRKAERTGEQLRRCNEIIVRRDTARTGGSQASAMTSARRWR